MKNIILILILSILFSNFYGQNIFRISEDSNFIILSKIDSIKENNINKIAFFTDLNSGKKRVFNFKTYYDFFGYAISEHQINENDTILIFANNKKDSLINRFAINENAKIIYNSLVEFKEIKEIKNNRKRLNKFKKWFVKTSIENGIKPYMSSMMRNKNERNYFFNLINLPENKFVFNNLQKNILTKNISKSRCLEFQDFYIVYLMRYSYDDKFEKKLKKIMINYCIPFGDGHIQMMKTIMYNKKSKELEKIYNNYKNNYFGDLEKAKKIYNEFIEKI